MPRPPRDTLPDSSHRDSTAPTSSSAGRGPDERLPVNPRRTKVAPDQRKRVAKACNRCNQKRIKCSGDQPCRQCHNGNRECRYPPQVQKVTITQSELNEYQATRRRHNALAARLNLLESLLQENGVAIPPVERTQTPSPDTGDGGAASVAAFSPQGDVTMGDAMDGSSELAEVQEDQGKLLTDNYGTKRFLGETSGANYLDGCKSFIVISHHIVCGNPNISSNSAFLAGRYQTFDSRPLNLPPVDPLWLPPAPEIATMIADISIYIQDGNGSFGSGGIFYWPWKDPASVAPSTTPGSKAGNRHLALYHAGFALAGLLKRQPSEQHFARAKSLLGDPLDGLHSLDDVPALALMALYLIENNRRDFASDYIIFAAQLSIKHGAHHRDNQTENSPAEEGRRRTFWTVYILDRWLSCLMGRQPHIDDNAIGSLPYPQEVTGLPSPAGLLANIKLAKISHTIVTHTYPSNRTDNSTFAKTIVDQLKEWNEDLPSYLTLGTSKTLEPIRDKEQQERKKQEEQERKKKEELERRNRELEYQRMGLDGTSNSLARLLSDSSLPEPLPRPKDQHEDPLEVELDRLTQVLAGRGTDRAYLSLHVSYNQLFILAFRPAFLAAVKKLVAERYVSHLEPAGLRPREPYNIEAHPLCYEFRASVEAARGNLMIGAYIKKRLEAPGNKLLVADLHHVFSAALVLLMYRISFVNERSLDTNYIKFATDVFETEESEYGKDCFAVLTELNKMVDGLRPRIHFNEWPRLGQQDEADGDYQQRLQELLSWRTEPWEQTEWESPVTDNMQMDENHEMYDHHDMDISN